jgi:hypothetical protein
MTIRIYPWLVLKRGVQELTWIVRVMTPRQPLHHPATRIIRSRQTSLMPMMMAVSQKPTQIMTSIWSMILMTRTLSIWNNLCYFLRKKYHLRPSIFISQPGSENPTQSTLTPPKATNGNPTYSAQQSENWHGLVGARAFQHT